MLLFQLQYNRAPQQSNIYNITHNYNTKHNPLVANNEENNVLDPQTSDLIINLEKKLLFRFDGLDKELLNLKDVIIKDLQVENQHNPENKIMSLGINGNNLEQYGRRNNLEITELPDDVSDENLEEKVTQVLGEIQPNFLSSDIEACHRIGKSKNSSKKQLYNSLIENTPKKH